MVDTAEETKMEVQDPVGQKADPQLHEDPLEPTPEAATAARAKSPNPADGDDEGVDSLADDTGGGAGDGVQTDDGATDIVSLKQRIDELEAHTKQQEEEHEQTKQRWLRSRADYDNLRRRTEREREELQKTAAARLIGGLLPQIEILERAARDIAEVDENHAKGVRMAVMALRSALEREGLQEVPGEGAPFDPNLHEAVAREHADQPVGTITQVVRPGYTLHGKLLQAALVKVSDGGSDDGATGQEGSSQGDEGN